MLNHSNRNPKVESISESFQKSKDIIEPKEHILAVVIMRYLFDEFLNRPLSSLLKEEEEDLLTNIYNNMETMEPPKGNLPIPDVLILILTTHLFLYLPTMRTCSRAIPKVHHSTLGASSRRLDASFEL